MADFRAHSRYCHRNGPITRLFLLTFFFATSLTSLADTSLRAGAYIQDVTAPFESLLLNGGFTERRRGKMNPGDLKARCFVLERGDICIALAVVDSCMIPRDVCDRAKKLVAKATGISPERIVITATHTHSAPSTMDYCLGTMADPAYTEFLPPKIAEGIAKAYAKREPARIGWSQVRAPDFTHCRRWLTRPDKMQRDPFGHITVRAMMHPGYQNPAYIGPASPVDDELSVLSIQTANGQPLAILANFSMHYYGGNRPADYFGLFSDRLAERLKAEGRTPVCAMSQGTSGDLHWMDYSQPSKGANVSQYTDGLVDITAQALQEIQYSSNLPINMDQRTLTLSRRLPDADRLVWADNLLANMKGRRPKNRPEVYAEQARFIHENPTEKLILQTLRIGDLGITTLPNEVYSITGLKLKARSPFDATFNIELANGAAGYIPPPAQHDLGGYTTWPARTAGLEVDAEPKIVETLLSSLEYLADKPRREPAIHHGSYAKAILAESPLAYWRCEAFEGPMLADTSANERPGNIEGVMAYHLPGPQHNAFSGEAVNRAIQFVGGTVSTLVPEAKSVSFWIWNGMRSTVRDNTGDIVQHGSMRLRIGGRADGDASGHLILQQGDRIIKGSTKLALHRWHNLVIARDRNTLNIYLDGDPKPDLQTNVATPVFDSWRFGGILPFEGRIDEVAWFEDTLSGTDAKRLYTTSGMNPPPRAAPPRPKVERRSMEAYIKAIATSKPMAHEVRFEKNVGPDGFNGGRMRTEIEGIGDTYSVAFWFLNRTPNHNRPVTAYLFSRGIDAMKEAEGDHLGIGGTYAAAGRLLVYNGNRSKGLLTGQTVLETDSWHHVAYVREGQRVRVYLNGNPQPEIDGTLPRSYPDHHPQFFFGGRNDNFSNLLGQLDHAALYNRILHPEEIAAQYRTVKLRPVREKDPSKKPQALLPADTLKTIHVPGGYRVELVAAEPLVMDPVAIDWAPDGKLWVAEMADYPSGIKEKPGGRIRLLEDRNNDGEYEHASLFLEGVNYPAGIMSWRNGVLIAAAPDILFAADTNNDGKADIREVLYTGFKQGNQQLRVNGLRWGLDNGVHGANGSHHARYAADVKITAMGSGRSFPLGSLDFRIRPDEGTITALSGPSQFGRVRDDWGNWFGVQNSFPLWHYVLEHRYLSRNPNFFPPDPRQQLRPRNALVFAAARPQKRFHSFNHSGRFTSACSPAMYRDRLLFDDELQHAFTCEPFHHLVQHVILRPEGPSFTAERAEANNALDFFASEDRWCRPVMARTGPDGALWVVDMYRYMIEHPEWLPAAGKAEMKPYERSGSEYGRIYRVVPDDKSLRKIPRLNEASFEELVGALADYNGTVRDLAHRLILERNKPVNTSLLSAMVANHSLAHARLHALCTLDGLDRLDTHLLLAAMQDPHPQIRRHALRLAEARWADAPQLLTAAIRLTEDKDAAVRLQAACSLGESNSAEAGKALARLMIRDAADPYIRAAVFSSARPHFDALAQAALEHGVLLNDMLKLGGHRNQNTLIARLAHPGDDGYQPQQFRALAGWLNQKPESVQFIPHDLFDKARDILTNPEAAVPLRSAAAGLLGRQSARKADDQNRLTTMLETHVSSDIKKAMIKALTRLCGDELPVVLLKGWPNYIPQERTYILDTLLQRTVWTQAYLEAIAREDIAPGNLDAARRQLLLTHKDRTIREAAMRVLKTKSHNQRRKHIESYRNALNLQGNEKRGRAVFDTRCAVCHLPPDGLPMNGPDLRSITDRSKEGLFSAILDPNQAVDASYTGYTITLKNGAALYGRVLFESDHSLTLRLLDGSERQLLRKDIQTLQSSGYSLMPEGLEVGMSHQDLADLIRFVQTFTQDNR